ncbi:MAG: hypothetical protein LBH74_09685, partial [Nitrososphaerota archaeon]|nr:hypothetical protein [Nitrososphaerota archaeon]
MKKIEFKKLTIILMALSMMIILVFAISMTANAATTTEVLTVAELQSALDSGVVDITIPPDTTLTLTCDITIQSSVTLTIQGTIYNDGYGTIYNYGRIANSGTINNYDHSIIYNHGTIDNSGVIDNVVYSTIYNYDYGRIANSGTISAFYFGGIYNHDSGTINNTGTINIDDSTIDNVSIIYNYGRIGSSGYSAIRNYDSGIIYNAGTIDNDGTIYNAGAIDNDGIIYNSGSGPIANYGIINNYGSIDKIYNADEIRFGEIRIANSGLIYNYGTINNLGCAIRANNGLLEPIRSIIDNKGGIISNFGEINNVGSTINNNGRIDNGGIINNKNRYTADFNQAIIVIVANSDGLINNNEGGTIDNNEGGTINNDYSSRIYNNIGSTIDNLGLINNYVWGEINNYGTFYGNSVANYYLVAFDETSYLFFRYNAQIIQEGDCAKLPDGPAREGFTFEGWYANYDNVFDPTIPISGNNYFHAKWVESHVEHDWDDGVVTTIATCVENGMIYYTCKVCGETYTALIVALDHTEGEPIIAFEPACTDEGTWEIWCTVCDVLLNSGVIPPLGHVWREIVTEPTCTDWGYTTYICANDETHNYVDNYVSAHGHHFVRIPMYYPAVIPYCDVYWYYVDECVFCGETILTPFQPIYVEHYWDSGSIVIPVTCIENGEMLFRCTYCGELRTEVIIA